MLLSDEEIESEIACLKAEQARKDLETKWRPILSRRLRQLADQIDAGCKWLELYLYTEEDGVEPISVQEVGQALHEATQEFQAISEANDEWGLLVPVQRRTKSVVTL